MAAIVVLSSCAIPAGTPEAESSSTVLATPTPIATATSIAALAAPATVAYLQPEFFDWLLAQHLP